MILFFFPNFVLIFSYLCPTFPSWILMITFISTHFSCSLFWEKCLGFTPVPSSSRYLDLIFEFIYQLKIDPHDEWNAHFLKNKGYYFSYVLSKDNLNGSIFKINSWLFCHINVLGRELFSPSLSVFIRHKTMFPLRLYLFPELL